MTCAEDTVWTEFQQTLLMKITVNSILLLHELFAPL